MGSIRTSRADRRRIVLTVAASSLLFMTLGRVYGEDIGLKLQETPTTTQGWLFVGWLISGPPFLIAVLAWHERGRIRSRDRRPLTWVIGSWIGLSMFVLPAAVQGVSDQFGTAAIVGAPLNAGWTWGILANVAGLVFSAVVVRVLQTSVEGKASGAQVDLTIRFLERAWLVLLIASLAFALYGDGSAPFNIGS